MTEMIYSILPRPMQRLKELQFKRRRVQSANATTKSGDATVEDYVPNSQADFDKLLNNELKKNIDSKLGSHIDDSV